MVEARVVKFCAVVGYILKGAWSGSCDQF